MTVVDTAARRIVADRLAGHEGGVEDIAFNVEGSALVSSGDGGKILVWPVNGSTIESGEVVAVLPDIPWAVAFDPTGEQVATASEDQTVRLWHADGSGQIGAPLGEGIGDGLSVNFSPDGSGIVVGTGSGAIYGWTLPGREPLMPVITDIHASDVWDVEFPPAGDRFATVGSDRTSALFTFPEGRYLGRAFDPENKIFAALFTRDGAGLIGSDAEGHLIVWSPDTDASQIVSAAGHTGRVIEIELSDEGKLLASLGRDQTVRLWTIFDRVPLSHDRDVAEGAAKGVAVSADGAILAAADETGLIQVWARGAAEPKDFAGHESQVWALALSPDGSALASGDRSGAVRIWDMESGEPAPVGEDRDDAIWWVGFTPDGERLVTAGDDGVDIYEAASGTWVSSLPPGSGPATRAAISPDGKILAVSTTDGRVRLFDLAENVLIRDLEVVEDIVWSAAFSPDGAMLAVGSSDEVVSLWDVATGERRASLGGHRGGATDLAFQTDAATLVATDRGGNLHLWDIVSERRLGAPIRAHGAASWRLAAAPEADLFVTTGDDGKVRTWDIMSVARACAIGAPAFDDVRRRNYFGEGVTTLACGKQ